MKYYFNTIVKEKNFEEAIELVTAELKNEGFGVLTNIDVKQTLKNKIDVDFKKYTILGACNPHFANRALQADDKVGVSLLPCNVVVEENESGGIEVSAIDPMAFTTQMNNEKLSAIASEVREKLERVIRNLG
jgi:uncharacterized protein (DUF302 family)